MGGAWLPDPPIGSSLSDEISIPTAIILDSDNDDAEAIENDHNARVNYNEYHLLTDGDNLPDWETVGLSDDEETEDTVQLTYDSQTDASDVQPIDENQNDSTPRDIAVDCDQVRAAMAHITLPPSATPSWAASIPDSGWCSFLQNRIRTLQEKDTQSTDLKAVTK